MSYVIRNRRTGVLVYGEFATKWDAAKHLILNHGTSYDRRYRIEVAAPVVYAGGRDHDCFINDDGCGFCNECGSMLVRA